MVPAIAPLQMQMQQYGQPQQMQQQQSSNALVILAPSLADPFKIFVGGGEGALVADPFGGIRLGINHGIHRDHKVETDRYKNNTALLDIEKIPLHSIVCTLD